MMRLRYEIVDVFTDQPFLGNPLAVVFDADDLDAGQMQSVAREFNLSETAFVLRPSGPADYRVRIFTPTHELPFAGHPSVGTAVTLLRAGRISAGKVVQECGAGNLPVSVSEHAATLTGGPAQVGEEVDPARLLAAVGLSEADHVGPPPRVAGCGVSFAYLPVRPEALARAVPDTAAWGGFHGLAGASVFAWDPAQAVAHTRVFAPGVGVVEDPATGSAALGFGVWLVASGAVGGDGTTSYTVRQGIEMHRASVMECTVTAESGVVTRTTVAGGVAAVAAGEIVVPPFVG